MAITSIGYESSIDEVAWARYVALLGARHVVTGPFAFKVRASATARAVIVGVGSAYGNGVLDTSDAEVTVPLDSVTSGSRWDTIVLRRDWQAAGGGATAPAVVKGTSIEAPAPVLFEPGVKADQILGLVQVTAGQLAPTAVSDWRRLNDRTADWPPRVARLATQAKVTNPSGTGAVIGTNNHDVVGSTWTFTPPHPTDAYSITANLALPIALDPNGSGIMRVRFYDGDAFTTVHETELGSPLRTSLTRFGSVTTPPLTGRRTVKANVEVVGTGRADVYVGRMDLLFAPAVASV